jgi:hypothetical protein
MEKAKGPLLRIATFNVEWFFTKAPFAELELCSVPEKASRLSEAIAKLGTLDALALQEVQSEEEVRVLCEELQRREASWNPKALCGQFASVRTGQRVAWLYNPETLRLRASGTFNMDSYELLEKNLWLDVEWKGCEFRMVCLHMKVGFAFFFVLFFSFVFALSRQTLMHLRLLCVNENRKRSLMNSTRSKSL